MSFLDLKEAVLVGFFLSFMIGPVFFMLIQTSITKGARAAITFDLGVILGDVSFILMAYYGSKSLLERIKDDPRLFFIGGIILLVHGIITYVDKSQKTVVVDETLVFRKKTNYVNLFIKGFLLNFINVGVLAFWLGMIVVVGPNLEMDSQKIFNYFLIILISYFITDIGKIVLAKQLKRKLTPSVIYKVKRGMGILLMIFGIALMLKGFIPKEKLHIENMVKPHKMSLIIHTPLINDL